MPHGINIIFYVLRERERRVSEEETVKTERKIHIIVVVVIVIVELTGLVFEPNIGGFIDTHLGKLKWVLNNVEIFGLNCGVF
ncbi:hypothetical protein Q3G72_004994 [Acer saccharum]|nr:hypothetical protein Q3G72_004994 [Acer saccharum]